MSILKTGSSAASILAHGVRHVSRQTLTKNSSQSNKAALLHGTNCIEQTFSIARCPVSISTRQIQSSSNNNAGHLSDPKNTGRRQSGVNFDTLGSWNNRLDLDVNLEQSIAAGRLIPRIKTESCASSTELGRRNYNEDRVSVEEINPDLLLFAIYDGHGGSTAVDYFCKQIPNHVKFWIEREETNLGDILKRAFNDAHLAFVRHLFQHHIGNDLAVGSGCTATVCLLHRGVQLVVAHVGDSQAILCRDGNQMTLTTPHKPEKVEKTRIEEAGGFVTYDSLGNPRVNGKLEMSRSLGDAELKNYGVISDPEIKAVQLQHGSDAFMILTTDGVHYVLSPQEIVDLVCSCKDPKEAANFLTDQALHYGSEDNCTALIVPFGAWGKYTEKTKMQFSFSRNFRGSRYQ